VQRRRAYVEKCNCQLLHARDAFLLHTSIYHRAVSSGPHAVLTPKCVPTLQHKRSYSSYSTLSGFSAGVRSHTGRAFVVFATHLRFMRRPRDHPQRDHSVTDVP